jgi:hypothetical protein
MLDFGRFTTRVVKAPSVAIDRTPLKKPWWKSRIRPDRFLPLRSTGIVQMPMKGERVGDYVKFQWG